MEKIKSMYGYDIYKMSSEECKDNYRLPNTLCAFRDDWDDEEDGERNCNCSECEFESIEEAERWCEKYCRKYDNKLLEVDRLAEELSIDWNAAFDEVYGTDYYGKEDETDDAI